MSKKTEAKNLAKAVKSKQAAKVAKKIYKLPSGKTTTSIGQYAAEWKSEAESLAMYMGDWKMASVDPDVTYSTPNGNITLPLWAVQRLTKAMAESAKEENLFVTSALQSVLADLKW